MRIKFFLNFIRQNYVNLFVDSNIAILSTYIAYSIKLESYYIPLIWNTGLDPIKSLYAYLFCVLSFIPIFILFKIYDFIPRYFDINFFIRVFYSSLLYAMILFVLFSITNFGIPRSLSIIQPIIFCFLICLIRISSIPSSKSYSNIKKNVILYGAGTAGFQLLNSINEHKEFSVKLFVDDDQKKIGKMISGIKIVALNDVSKYLKKYKISSMIISIPSLNLNEKRQLIERCKNLDVEIKTLPSLSDIMEEKVTIKNINDLNINDLIARDIKIGDLNKENFENKNILISGAGGSIGSELSKQLIFYSPKKIILLDHSEFNLYAIKEKLEKIIELNNLNTDLVFTLTSVNNSDHLRKLLSHKNINFVFHAAAYKHVDIVEDNILEALNNNFFGTLNLVSLCEELEFENFILISSDKAVRPSSIMGATKRLSELIVQAYSSKTNSKTVYSIVRFGNVLGSSGSVINKFNQQIESENFVTVTHPKVTRFFMTVKESVNLILHACLMAKGGEIFLLDMGEPVKIIDIAKKMISLRGLKVRDKINTDGVEIKIIGLKPGEKLYEELLIDANAEISENPNIFYGKDSHIDMNGLNYLITDLKEIILKDDFQLVRNFLKEKVLLKDTN